MVNYKTNIKTCSKVKNNIQFYFHQSLPLHNKLNTNIKTETESGILLYGKCFLKIKFWMLFPATAIVNSIFSLSQILFLTHTYKVTKISLSWFITINEIDINIAVIYI